MYLTEGASTRHISYGQIHKVVILGLAIDIISRSHSSQIKKRMPIVVSSLRDLPELALVLYVQNLNIEIYEHPL